MTPITVAIITNESNQMLIKTIESYATVVDEVCIGVNGDQVDEAFILKFTSQYSNVKIYKLKWEGYGPTKNKLQTLAKNDWILSVDADECASEELKQFLKTFQPTHNSTIFQFQLINHLGQKPIRYGAWGNGKKYYSRLFNKKLVSWNDSFVHEELSYNQDVNLMRCSGQILHFSAQNINEVREKNKHYASLSARVKYNKGKKTYFLKRYISGIYTFIKEYFIQLGFLDGVNGWQLAIENSRYSYNKYRLLYELYH